MARQLLVWLAAGVTLAVSVTMAGGTSALAQASQRAVVPALTQQPIFPVLNGVWCAGPSKCLTVGTDNRNVPISMLWNGQDWSRVGVPARGQRLNALACTSWTHCLAVGPGVADEWNGTSWHSLRGLPSPARLFSVACPGRRTCVAVGYSQSAKDTAFVWNGRSWRAATVPWPAGVFNPDLTSVACPSVRYCIAVGNYEASHSSLPSSIAVTWNGARWRRAPTPPGEAFAIACPRLFLCVGVSPGQSVMWNRRSWRPVSMPLMYAPAGISCPGTSFCMVDDTQLTAVWNGTSWSSTTPARNNTSALWCGSPADCMAVGADTNSLSGNASQWNGHTWRKLRVTKVDDFEMISCASTTDCVAVGTANPLATAEPLAEEWDGTAWTVIAAPTVTSDDGYPPALSCPTASFCMAAGTGPSPGQDPQAQWWDGSTWHATSVPATPDGGLLASLSCTSQDNCVLVTGLDAAMVWNGSTWTATSAAITGLTVVLTSVSCSGAICMASGWGTGRPSTCGEHCRTRFVAEEWNGSAWTVSANAPFPHSTFPYSSISCPTATFCMEAGFNDSAKSWNGTSWQSVTGKNLFVGSLSCASAMSCLMVNTSASLTGDTLTFAWNGTSWRAATSTPAGDALVSVSCPGAGTCIAAGGHYYVRAIAQSWNGTNWTSLAPVNP